MRIFEFLRRIFTRRQDREWLWRLPGSYEYVRATYNPALKITFPDVELADETRTEVPALVVSEERSFHDLPFISAVETALHNGRVVLGFSDGRVLLESHHPFVKDFVQAADRMMRPGRRSLWLKGRLDSASKLAF